MPHKIFLNTQPHFEFPQGDLFDGETCAEYPIKVSYFTDCISLEQNGNSINLRYDDAKEFTKTLLRHIPEAIKQLELKNKK